jgi:hypothetical protein
VLLRQTAQGCRVAFLRLSDARQDLDGVAGGPIVRFVEVVAFVDCGLGVTGEQRGYATVPRHKAMISPSPHFLTPDDLARDAMRVIVASSSTRVALSEGADVVQARLAGHTVGLQVALEKLGVRTVTEAESYVALWRP